MILFPWTLEMELIVVLEYRGPFRKEQVDLYNNKGFLDHK